MKKRYSILISILCMIFLAGCQLHIETSVPPKTETQEPIVQNYTEIRVSTPKDLFQNIKPYTRIILTEKYYNLSTIDAMEELSNVEYDDWFIGGEYTIHDIDHIEICTEKNYAKLVVNSGHVNVLNFKNCSDIKLKNLVLGHEIEKGSCFGGVIHLEACHNVEIDQCHLYGCGTYGIIANEINNLNVINSEIYDCTEGIMQLIDCNNLFFTNSSFHDNEELSAFMLTNCNSFLLENCNITNNICNNFSSLFYTNGCRNITMKNCTFRNNTYPSFGDKEEYNIIDCLIEDKSNDKPIYYDVDPEYEF